MRRAGISMLKFTAGPLLRVGRQACAVASSGDTAYVIGGHNEIIGFGEPFDTVEAYTYSGGGWTLRSFPHRLHFPRYSHGVATDRDDRIYVIGGSRTQIDQLPLRTVERLEPRGDLGWEELPPLPTTICGPACGVLEMDGRPHLIVTGGAHYYDPNLSFAGGKIGGYQPLHMCFWLDLSNLAHGWRGKALDDSSGYSLVRRQPGYAVVDNKLWLFGGAIDHEFATNSVSYFDPSEKKIVATKYRLKFERFGCAAACLGNRAILMGGHSNAADQANDPSLDSIEIVEISGSSLTISSAKGSLTSQRYRFGAAIIQRQLFVAGGDMHTEEAFPEKEFPIGGVKGGRYAVSQYKPSYDRLMTTETAYISGA